MQIINKTSSICNKCLKRVPAEVYEKDGSVYIRKYCTEHGEFISPHVWDDPATYKYLLDFHKFRLPSRKGLINITNRCNMDCPFCYAMANELHLNSISFEEIKKLNLDKLHYIFLSGGEPTIEKDIFKIIQYLKKKKKTVFLLTNGIKLQEDDFVKKLKESRIDLVILQFDSLSEEDYLYLRGQALLNIKKKAMQKLAEYNIPTYFFSIQLKKDNLNKMKAMLEYFNKYKMNLKGINFNTLWKIGRYNDEHWMSTKEITDNCIKAMRLEKNDFLISTEFIYYLFIMISKFKDNRRYFSKCLLFMLVVFDGKKIIPINKIFNLKKLIYYLKQVVVEDKKIKILNLGLYILFSQFLINFFVNRNFRVLLKETFTRLKFIGSKNKFLLNPFTTFNVGEFPTAEDFDFNFVETCNLLNYSPEDGRMEPVCLHQIKFARKRQPVF